MFVQSLFYSDFHIDSDFEICLFVLDLETTYVTHFSEVPTVPKSQAPKIKIWDSFTWSGFSQGYSLDFIKASLSKYKWTLTSVSWTWNYIGSLVQPTIPYSVPNIPAYRLVPTSRESTILTKNSQPPFSTTQPPFFVSPL